MLALLLVTLGLLTALAAVWLARWEERRQRWTLLPFVLADVGILFAYNAGGGTGD